MSNVVDIILNKKTMKPNKASISPFLGTRNVLTNSHWDFVELWLKREGKSEALFYWNQARVFNSASIGLPNQSAPLLHYYSFMNAAKALLASKDIQFNPHHGVGKARGGEFTNIDLSSTGVNIRNEGVVASIANYLGDVSDRRQFSLKDMFYNLPYIHRTYCLTYQTENDMFIPIKNARFVLDLNNGDAYLSAKLSKDFSYEGVSDYLTDSFQLVDESNSSGYEIKSSEILKISHPYSFVGSNHELLKQLHKRVRCKLYYINGAETLWYIKGKEGADRQINNSTITITLAAMHRLSEISRYEPFKLVEFLGGEENWIIAEFIQQSPAQFIDEISSEITGHQFLIPNVRIAN